MNFEINGMKWTIKEVEQNEFWKDDNKERDNSTIYFGRTKYDKQEIWLDKDISDELKRKTLYHELMHCYKSSFICIYDLENQSEDFWCDLSANSHDIIHAIVESYFNQQKYDNLMETIKNEQNETCK